jgi:hypothetical protein
MRYDRGKVKDRVGQIMGRMVVRSFSHQNNDAARNAIWNIECLDCGYTTKAPFRPKTKHGCKRCHGRNMQKLIKYKQSRGKDLYMFRCGPYVKIGVSDNVPLRLAAVQASNPYPVELTGFWEGEGHREEEWHNALQHLHVSGEWFKIGSRECACELP